MKIADQRDIDSHFVELLANRCDFGSGFGRVDSDAHDLRSGLRELFTWIAVAIASARIGVRHRLHDHRRIAADTNALIRPATLI